MNVSTFAVRTKNGERLRDKRSVAKIVEAARVALRLERVVSTAYIGMGVYNIVAYYKQEN